MCFTFSCHTHKRVISHIYMSHVVEDLMPRLLCVSHFHVTLKNESYHTYKWVTSWKTSCIVCYRFHIFMSHTRTSHITHINESRSARPHASIAMCFTFSCHTHKRVISHIYMSHVVEDLMPCLLCVSRFHVTLKNESYHTYTWVTSGKTSCLVCDVFHIFMSHTQTSHITHIHESRRGRPHASFAMCFIFSCHTHKRVISHIYMSHVVEDLMPRLLYVSHFHVTLGSHINVAHGVHMNES